MRLVVAVHAGHVHHVGVADEAVAGVVVDRQRVGRAARQQRDDGGRRHLAVLVGHVARFGHQRRHLQRVAQDVDVLGGLGFHGLPIDLAPALVGGGQARVVGNVAGALGRHDVQHLRLQVVVELELERAGGGIDVGQVVLGAVVDDAFVAVGPGLLEQRAFRRDVVVGVQDQHLGLGLGLAEVVRHLAGALVGPWRAAVGRQRNGQRIDAAIGHGFELPAQSHGLRAGLPRMQHLVLRAGLFQAGQRVPHEFDARRQHQAVVWQHRATSQRDGALAGVDGDRAVLDDLHTVAPGQVVVGRGDVGHLLAAADDQVGDRARDEAVIGLDQRDIDAPLGPHADVLGRRGAAVAAADDDHVAPRAAATARGGATCGHAEHRCGRASLNELTTIHGVPPHFFCAANHAVMAASCSSV